MWNGLKIVAPLVLIVVLGAVLRRVGFLKDDDRDRLTGLLYWVVLPCLLFRSMYRSGGISQLSLNMFLGTYLPFFLVPVVALAVAWLRRPGGRRRLALCAMSSVRANNIYLGLPAAYLAMGEAGQAAASIYIAVMLPGYNLLSILWGEAILSGGLSPRTVARTLVRLTRNPLVSSCILGLVCAQLRVPVPDTLIVSLGMVGEMAVGLALISLGIGVDFSDIGHALRRTWPDVLIKLFVHPAVSLLCFVVWPVADDLVKVAVLLCAMPTAINTFIIAEGMKMEGGYIGEVIAVSTTGAALTIPIWLSILGVS